MPESKERLVRHITQQYVKRGKTEEEAKAIAWATVTKQEKEEASDDSE